MRTATFVVVVLALGAVLPKPAPADYPPLGQPAPKVEVSEWISGTTPAASDFEGRALVIEFWATWCAPCRLSIPHMNRIANELAGDAVTFVAITDEKPGIVAVFLQTIPIDGYVGCDIDRSIHSAFGVEGVPRAFLVNADGILCWQGHPMSLTSEALRSFVRDGIGPPIRMNSNKTDRESLPVLSSTLYSLTVNHSVIDLDARESGMTMTDRTQGGRYESHFRGQSLSTVLARLLNVTPPRIRVNLSVEEEPILDVSLYVSMPMNTMTGRTEAASVLCRAFGLQMNIKSEPTSGWSLHCPHGDRLVPTPAENSGTYLQHGIWSASGIELSELSTSLESLFGEILFTDADIAGTFDFELPSHDFRRAMEVLRDRYGITSERVERSTEVYVIDPISDVKR